MARGLAVPELVIVDGASGLEKAGHRRPVERRAAAALYGAQAPQPAGPCAEDTLLDEISADYADMIYAKTVTEVDAKRRVFLRKWRLRCRPVAASLEEAGDQLFTFLRFPSDQWKSIRTTNAIERLHE